MPPAKVRRRSGGGSGGGSGRPRLSHAMVVPARRSLIVPFRELQPSLRQLRRIYRGTRAVLMGEEVARDPARSQRDHTVLLPTITPLTALSVPRTPWQEGTRHGEDT